jgi:hypothetical protein
LGWLLAGALAGTAHAQFQGFGGGGFGGGGTGGGGAASRTQASASPPMAVVSQIFFPSMTGEDHARPGNSVFQVTLFVSLHDAGRPVACA